MVTPARGQPRNPDYLEELKVMSSSIILLRQKGNVHEGIDYSAQCTKQIDTIISQVGDADPDKRFS
jgi:hypothetical protein